MHALETAGDLTALVEEAGDRPVVMLGEASHGTHEYYTWRTAITKRLITEKGFHFIAVEGDWPDCYRINRYIKGYADAGDDIRQVLESFDRWPSWMWANWEVAALAEWLRDHNRSLSPDRKVGFYGLDVYSLWDSMKTMMVYLEKEYPQAARSVKEAIRCFEPFGEDVQQYAYHTLRDHGCRDEVLALLKEVRLKAQFLDGDREAGFNTEQNALIAVNAEKYYRSMIGFDRESWNVRDRHMMETLDRLLRFHGSFGVGTGPAARGTGPAARGIGPTAKGIVWEHNTHIGDARATPMRRQHMVNTGQLAREAYGEEKVYLAGFASYRGTVIAGEEWGAPMEEMEVPSAREGSIEAALHRQGTRAGGIREGYFLFSEENDPDQPRDLFHTDIYHRAIGVVYSPEGDRQGNYVPSLLSRRYDAFIYLDETRALHPLHLHPDRHKLPETYPFAL